jgi:diguanylate cyclase (GGDEF)-like protein
MSSPGASVPPRLPVEDAYLELLSETLEGLDAPARGQFLRRYFRAITHLELSETQCTQLWDDMLVRRRELSSGVGRAVSLHTALTDVLASSGFFRVPILIEYEELKTLQLNAVTDPLTNLYNRRLFTETFEKELNRARRYGLPLALALLDLHRFKEVNDMHGHPRGDDVLRAAASTLKKALRTSDSAFRIGGDEFAVLLPQTDAAQALALSRRIEAVFAEMLRPLHLGVAVSMDHGVATFPQDGEQTDPLIRVADERLYRLKHSNHGKPAAAEAPPPQPESPPSAASAPVRETPAPAPVSTESKRTLERTEPPVREPSAEAESAAPAGLRLHPVQRKAERVSMSGTNAYALLGDPGTKRARVVDLGFGGVALELEGPEELPENILAVLHVPILPPVRVSLKPVWSRRTVEGSYRVGCTFVS